MYRSDEVFGDSQGGAIFNGVCDDGNVINRLYGSHRNGRVEKVCYSCTGDSSQNKCFGTSKPGGKSFSVKGPLSQIKGYSDKYVNGLYGQGGKSGKEFAYKCPKNTFLSGLYGGVGNVVDRIGVWCGAKPAEPAQQPAPAVIAVSGDDMALVQVQQQPEQQQPEQVMTDEIRDDQRVKIFIIFVFVLTVAAGLYYYYDSTPKQQSAQQASSQRQASQSSTQRQASQSSTQAVEPLDVY